MRRFKIIKEKNKKTVKNIQERPNLTNILDSCYYDSQHIFLTNPIVCSFWKQHSVFTYFTECLG